MARMLRRAPPCPPIALLVLLAAWASPLSAQLPAGEASPPVAAPRPHVVLILADDMGCGDIAALNPDSRIPTPHLDRLVAEGTSLSDAHAPAAVCTPTRYGLLTGRYCWRTRLTSWVLDGEGANLMDPARETVADVLRAAGYATHATGKWHLGLGDSSPVDWSAPLVPGPVDHGFDSFHGIPASLDFAPYVWVLDDHVVQTPSATVAGSAHRRQGGGGFWRAGAAAPDFRHVEVLPRTTARAVELIERGAREEPERPQFLYVALSAPHTPWLPTEPHHGASDAGWYGDFVAHVDAEVGRIVDALRRTGRLDHTLLVFTSDNGAHWPVADVERFGHDSHLGRRGQKADIHEGGHRVPFVVRWPGRVPAGVSRAGLFGLTDVLPTLAGLAGVPLGDHVAEDGVDQWPLLSGSGASARDHLVHHSGDGLFALRVGPWKLIDGLGSGGFTTPRRPQPEDGGPRGQLYNLRDDPGETDNRWLHEPERVAELRARLEALKAAGRSR